VKITVDKHLIVLYIKGESQREHQRKEPTMLKKEMAIEIASVLFEKEVDETNWKVKDLMKQKKHELTELFAIAEKVRNSKWLSDKVTMKHACS
jgi:hypothetical protein